MHVTRVGRTNVRAGRIEGSAVVEIELPNGARVRVPSGDAGALSAAIAAAGRLSPHSVEEASPC